MKIKAEKKNMRLAFMGKRVPRSFPQNQPVEPVLISRMPTSQLITVAFGRRGLPRFFQGENLGAHQARVELEKRKVLRTSSDHRIGWHVFPKEFKAIHRVNENQGQKGS